ncbi:CynX/NimT family MFS transporter [Streptomyces roseirectus]|uniref:CynX/NimT family MFS transporter n=1 Tax=Streptomyces roseirectus TaxID=2768066 RepID=UPI001FE3002E|nr:MFS transporter [Streptomyces roseirectus]
MRRAAVVALVLAALNLRPGVTSLGPVLEEVSDSLDMSGSMTGLVTAVPAVCFAVVGSVTPLLARRFGAGSAIAVAGAVLAVGLALRPFAFDAVLFLVFTALSLAGIAVVNVLLPMVVKQYFPDRVGTMTGLYSMALNVGASSAAALTAPLTEAFGGDWRYGLATWSVLAALAVPAWLTLAARRPPDGHIGGAAGPPGSLGTPSPPGSPVPPPAVETRLSRDPTARALAAYFGLQASVAYIIIGWLPQIYRDAGLSAGAAGLLFSVSSLLGIPLSFAVSAAADRMRHQSGLAVATGVCGFAGFTGLLVDASVTPWLWAILLGIANCSFPLALAMIGMRGRDSASSARLSGFVQSRGYALSIPGSLLVGVLYDRSGGWRLPIAFVLLLTLLQMAAAVPAGRNRRIG